MRTGGPSGATSRPRSASRTSTGVASPGVRRRSVRWPSYRSSATIALSRDGPGVVAGEGVDLAVGGGDLELGEHGEPVAVQGVLAVEAEPAAEPAVADQELEPVLAGPDQAGDVVRLVAKPLLVRRPARRELVVADPLAVEFRQVDAVGGGVEAGLHDVRGQLGDAGEQGSGGAVGVVPRADEASGPVVGAEQTGLDDRRLTPLAPVVITADAHADLTPTRATSAGRPATGPGPDRGTGPCTPEPWRCWTLSRPTPVADLDLVRRLRVPGVSGRDLPRQPGRRGADAQDGPGIGAVFEAERGGCGEVRHESPTDE